MTDSGFKLFLLAGLILALLFLDGLAPRASRAVAGPNPEESYQEIKKNVQSLEKSPQKNFRPNWQSILNQFQQLYKTYPQTEAGEKSMFMVGRIYLNLYQWSGASIDLDLAADHFTRFINHYPQSPLADDALYKLAEISYRHEKKPDQARERLQKLLGNYPQGDMRNKAEALLARMEKQPSAPPAPPSDPTPETLPTDPPRAERKEKPAPPETPETETRSLPQVTGLRYWSTPEYTRIVVDVGEKISFKERLLKKDPSLEKPQRLYLDLHPARLAKDIKDPIIIEDGLLRAARAGQFDQSTVRVVLDIQNIKGYKVFFLENPFRLIIDVTGREKGTPSAPDSPGKDHKLSIAQQLGLGVKRVVIDAGHGGKDKGAICEGVFEKDLTLVLAKKLAHKLRQEMKVQAILTRDSDRYLPLEERTAIANTKMADLFVSIHVNASPNPLAQGVETYFLNLATDEESVRVAALENATSTKRLGDLQKILKDLMLNTKIDESSRLAHHVQSQLVHTLNGKFGPIKNLGVKQAPFYVLIGAQMPSILVETSFISNTQDRERLIQEEYQDQIVDGIYRGLEHYVKETKLGWEKPAPHGKQVTRR